MSIFVYFSDDCMTDARKHGVLGEVEKFRERVERTQSLNLFDTFPQPYLVKKKIGGRQGRLVAERRTVGEHAVIVFLAILIRGDRAYEQEFSKDPHAYGQQHFANIVSSDQLESFVQSRTKSASLPLKPEPTDAEYSLLYNAFAHHADTPLDDLVYETPEWVDQISRERVSNQLTLFHKPIMDALAKDPGLHFVPVAAKKDWGIWALRRSGRLLLITPVTDDNAVAAKSLAHALSKQLDGNDDATVLRYTRRVYPALILADDDHWIELEKEAVANIALSPEESDVLESARGADHPFPLFINGRAGSGKSTILQYLFTDLMYFYVNNPESRVPVSPLYLTANGELLRRAKVFVEKVLRGQATFKQLASPTLLQDSSDTLSDTLNDAFREFQPFLLSLLPREVHHIRFATHNRVDYARFRRLWMERFGKDTKALRDFPPDLSWHVIRSYIKGMSSETFLEPDDYGLLPENQLSVTSNAFRLVYDRVWTGWYEHLSDKNLWDDQDLTRFILDNDLVKPLYPAVFCDEAQDFTRLELELLLRLSLFSNRTVLPKDISRVPFAFAGDQFQTLNPTGFRWDAVKSAFVEKFISALDPERRSGRTELNYRELKYNYRSTRSIVRFGNHVQAMRASLFQLTDLRPQTPWLVEPRPAPVLWFRVTDAGFWKQFRKMPGFVVIIPCGEGEEAAYVKNDPVLREHVTIEDGVPLNVLSAARAKGCEYPAVIVYGFGAATETDIASEITHRHEPNGFDPDRSLPLQYFINRLYVAVSRPKRRLVVVDTEEGFKRLWRCAQDETAEGLMLDGIRNGRSVWQPEITGMIMGSPDALVNETGVDPLENAKTFENEGIARQDAFLLRQAAQAYRSAGDSAKVKECRARALEADGELIEAGDAYFEAGFAVPEGLRCLWRAGAGGWARLCEQWANKPEIQGEVELKWARCIVEPAELKEIADSLVQFAGRLSDRSFTETCQGDPIWSEALSSLLEPLLSKDLPAAADPTWIQIARTLDRIRAKDVVVPLSTLAQVYFRAGRVKEAVTIWDQSDVTIPPAYLKAKASVEPYPQRILSLSKLGLTDDIIKAYFAERAVVLDREQTVAVVAALGEDGQWPEALNLAIEARLGESMLDIAIGAFHAGDRSSAALSLHAGIACLVEGGRWEPLAAFVSSQDFTPTAEWRDREIKRWINAEQEPIKVTLVRWMARSARLPDAPIVFLRPLTDFLRQYLRVRDGSWRTKLTVYEAGAASERGGRFTDSIAFYEAIIKERLGDTESQFARRRWLVCKQRQFHHEKALGGAVRAKEIEREIRQQMATLQIKSVDELPPFPELPELELLRGSINPAGQDSTVLAPGPAAVTSSGAIDTSPPGQFEITVGPFKMEVSGKNRRCNITNTVTMETGFIRLAEKKCGGEVVFNSTGVNRWVSDSWKMTVQFPGDAGEKLYVHLPVYGVSLMLSV